MDVSTIVTLIQRRPNIMSEFHGKVRQQSQEDYQITILSPSQRPQANASSFAHGAFLCQIAHRSKICYFANSDAQNSLL